jgi:hypothetical protein
VRDKGSDQEMVDALEPGGVIDGRGNGDIERTRSWVLREIALPLRLPEGFLHRAGGAADHPGDVIPCHRGLAFSASRRQWFTGGLQIAKIGAQGGQAPGSVVGFGGSGDCA